MGQKMGASDYKRNQITIVIDAQGLFSEILLRGYSGSFAGMDHVLA
jgi:hypothetical protein